MNTEQETPGIVKSDAETRGVAGLSVSLETRNWRSDFRRIGAVLFRGFGLSRPEDISEVAQTLGLSLAPYMFGQSPRSEVQDQIYTSTEYPARFDIPLHHELSYVPAPPRYLLFLCQAPAESGGETTLVDGRKVTTALSPEIAQELTTRGVRYAKTMHAGIGLGRSWQEHFHTNEATRAEQYLERVGAAFSWLDDGGLRITIDRPAFAFHPDTRERVWFNQAHLWHASNSVAGRSVQSLLPEDRWPTHAYFADGGPIPDSTIAAVNDALNGLAISVPWEAGDLLLVDNHLVAHGRRPFEGSRRILFAMAEADEVSAHP